jgi:hypothetical protein
LAPQNRQVKVEVVCFPGEPKGEFRLLAHTEGEKRRLRGLAGFFKNLRKKFPAGLIGGRVSRKGAKEERKGRKEKNLTARIAKET